MYNNLSEKVQDLRMVEIDLTNKVAFVTGASSDLGKVMVEILAGCGANVGMMDRCIDELIKLETTINAKSGGSAFAIQGDVSCPADLEIAIWQTIEVFGGIDLAVLL